MNIVCTPRKRLKSQKNKQNKTRKRNRRQLRWTVHQDLTSILILCQYTGPDDYVTESQRTHLRETIVIDGGRSLGSWRRNEMTMEIGTGG